MFQINEYKNVGTTRYCMHCKTLKEAGNFCDFLHSQGRRWNSGDSYAEIFHWGKYREDTCYNFNQGSFCDIEWYESQGYIILEWSDYMKDTTKAMNNSFTDKNFKLEDYKDSQGKIYCMHCKTEEEAKNFCDFLHYQGRRWRNGESYLYEKRWEKYEEDTCYLFNKGAFGCIKDRDPHRYKILEWSDFMGYNKCSDNTDLSMEKIFQVFEILGIKPNRPFKIRSNGSGDNIYRTTDTLRIQFFNGKDFSPHDSHLIDLYYFLTTREELVPTVIITEEDKIIIDYARLCGAKWLTKDRNGGCWMSENKPQKATNEWRVLSGMVEPLIKEVSFLSWEDEEPYEIV